MWVYIFIYFFNRLAAFAVSDAFSVNLLSNLLWLISLNSKGGSIWFCSIFVFSLKVIKFNRWRAKYEIELEVKSASLS